MGAVVLPGRTGTLAADEHSYIGADGTTVTLSRAATGRDADDGLVVTAPQSETDLDAAVASATAAAAGAPLVVLTGGTRLTRSLLSERIRFSRLAPTVIATDTADEDQALTLVLSGRADAVAYPDGGAR